MSAHRVRRGLATVTVVAAAATLADFTVHTAGAAPGQAQAPATGNVVSIDGPARASQPDTSTAIVTLAGKPLSTHPRTKPKGGEKVNTHTQAAREVRAEMAKQRDRFTAWLDSNTSASVTDSYDLALNAVAVDLNGAGLEDLREAPGVKDVEFASTYRLLDDADPGLNLIRAIEAWQTAEVGGPTDAGKGVKVGIIDSGIDVNHPCFDDAEFPETEQAGDPNFTNNKVIVAKVFNTADPTLTPEDVDGHGSHVAGTAACNLDTPANVHDVKIPYQVSGVAPSAQVGNYNVFPGDTLTVTDPDLLDAMEEAYADDMDVINMSLGGPPVLRGPDLLAEAVNNLDEANLVSAIAAGNSGPGHETIQSPGVAERGLTAGASTVGHFVGAPITVGETVYPSSTGEFEVVDSDLTAPLGVVAGDTNGLGLACQPLADDLSGAIAVVSRGECTFSTKVRNAEDAGAVATVIVNMVAGDPTVMAADPAIDPPPTIPAYMVGLKSAADLVAADGAEATIGADLGYFRSDNDNIMAGFSSQGPTPDLESRVKPDVVAPGVNELSAAPLGHCDEGAADCWAFNQGTSMASPHLAGMAAVVRGAHPEWTAEQVRSAVVNTATDGVLTEFTDGSTVVTDVDITGAGLGNLLGAVEATLAVGPVSTSFGMLTGVRANEATVELTSLTGAEQQLTLVIDPNTDAVTFSAPQTVTVVAHGVTEIAVAAQREPGRPPSGHHSATLRFFDGDTEIAHTVLFTIIR